MLEADAASLKAIKVLQTELEGVVGNQKTLIQFSQQNNDAIKAMRQQMSADISSIKRTFEQGDHVDPRN